MGGPGRRCRTCPHRTTPECIHRGLRVGENEPYDGKLAGDCMWQHGTRRGLAHTIVEVRHALRGQSFAGKVLVFPGAKGSSGWSNAFHLTRTFGVAPAAMLFNEMTTKIALGAVVTRAPALTDFDRDPLALIETGDWVRVDADRGLVEVIKAAQRSKAPA